MTREQRTDSKIRRPFLVAAFARTLASLAHVLAKAVLVPQKATEGAQRTEELLKGCVWEANERTISTFPYSYYSVTTGSLGSHFYAWGHRG